MPPVSFVAEGLRERGPVEVVDEPRVDRRVEDRVVADGRDARRLVGERDLDRVRADDARLDVVVAPGLRGLVEPVDEVLQRLVVVLDLDQSDDVGVDLRDRGDDLGPLALELRRRVRPARVRVLGRERREVVQDVERGDLDVAADVLGLGRPLVDLGVLGGGRRLDAVVAEGEVEHAGDARDRVTAAEAVDQVEHVAVRVDRRVRVLRVAAVVEHDPAEQVRLRERRRLGEPGSYTAVGVICRPTVRTVSLKRAKSKYSEIVRLLREGDRHALELLQVGEAADGQLHRGRRDRPLAGADLDAA